MEITNLLADPTALCLEQINAAPTQIKLVIRAVQPSSACSLCHQSATRVHSRYVRQLADLPWHGIVVRLELHVRRFRCRNELCRRRLFCETLPRVVARYARKVLRLEDALRVIGFAVGGEAGSRVAMQLGMSTSPDTLIRRVRRAMRRPAETPRVLGVDDFALRRGRHYGTILVDLERHRVIDLLADREAGTLRNWLVTHPGVEIISRDRALAYAEGASLGAPRAVQVADRFHLVKNMSEAVERLLERKHAVLRQAAEDVKAESAAAEISNSQPPTMGLPTVELTRPEREKQHRRERRLARYEEVMKLLEQGHSQRQVARLTRLSRQTVRKYINAGSFRETAHRPFRGSRLDEFAEHLGRRWAEGCHQATELWREVCEQGYTGAYSWFCEYLSRRYKAGTAAQRQRHAAGAAVAPAPRRVMWLLLKDGIEAKPDEQAVITRLLGICPEVQKGVELARRFQEIVRGRKKAEIAGWLAEAKASGIAELIGFVGGVERDKAAVEAALCYEWSQGQVEGQVNRLKMIKRSMFGRAKLDLLRQRVLAAI